MREELLQLLAASDRAEQQPTLPAIAVVAQQIAQEPVTFPVLEHYEVLQALGRGGMGEVVLARDKRLHRKVALKFLSPAFAADHQGLQMLGAHHRAETSAAGGPIGHVHDGGKTY